MATCQSVWNETSAAVNEGGTAIRCNAELGTLTLGLQEHALLNTGLEGTVEERVEHRVGGVNLIVCLDILLQALAAEKHMSC